LKKAWSDKIGELVVSLTSTTKRQEKRRERQDKRRERRLLVDCK